MTYDCERCHWDKQKVQHFKDCPCKCHETIEAVPDIPRCEKCQWPLAKSVEEGCVPENCSMRPVPKKYAEDSVKFWSDKYDTKVDELHEMWKEARSFEGSFNSATKMIAKQMGIIDRLTKETFELKKDIAHLKESRSKWAKQSSENADLYEKAISSSQPSPKAPQEREAIKRYANPAFQTNGPDVLAKNGEVPFEMKEIELIPHPKGKYVLYEDHLDALKRKERES